MRRKLLLLCASAITSAAALATPVRASTDIPCPTSDWSCVSLCTNMSMYCKSRLPHNITNCFVDTADSYCRDDGDCHNGCDPWTDPYCYQYTAQCYYIGG